MIFTRNDLLNLQALLKRGNYTGLEEAQVAVFLDQKIKRALSEDFLKEQDVNLPTDNQ